MNGTHCKTKRINSIFFLSIETFFFCFTQIASSIMSEMDMIYTREKEREIDGERERKREERE